MFIGCDRLSRQFVPNLFVSSSHLLGRRQTNGRSTRTRVNIPGKYLLKIYGLYGVCEAMSSSEWRDKKRYHYDPRINLIISIRLVKCTHTIARIVAVSVSAYNIPDPLHRLSAGTIVVKKVYHADRPDPSPCQLDIALALSTVQTSHNVMKDPVPEVVQTFLRGPPGPRSLNQDTFTSLPKAPLLRLTVSQQPHIVFFLLHTIYL